MLNRLFAALAVVTVALPAGTALADKNFSPAKRAGPPDLSLFCPAGSTSVPSVKKPGTMNCLSCPSGKKPTAKLLCPSIKKVKRSKPKRAGSMGKLALTCKIGSFRRPKTRECYTCPKGYFRDPLQKFGVNNRRLCMTAPLPISPKPKVVATYTLKDMVNPKKIEEGVRNLGCKGYGKGAFFDPIAGGSCYACPASHPKRTLAPVFTKGACGTAKCGGLGQRPCNPLFGEGRACQKGLTHNPFKRQCVAKRNVACKPLVGALRATYDGINKANALGEKIAGDAKDKIPGLAFLLNIVDGASEKIEQQAYGLLAKLPMDKLKADIDKAFRSPEEVRAMALAMQALADSKDDLTKMILDSKTLCDNPQAIADFMVKRVNASQRAALDSPGFGDALKELLGVSTAHASGSVVSSPFLRGKALAFTVSATVNVNIKGITVPVGLGLEALGKIERNGGLAFSVNFVGGVDFPRKGKLANFGGTAPFVSVGLGDTLSAKSCKPWPLAGQVEGGGLVGLSANNCGLLGINFNLGNTPEAPDITKTMTAGGLLPLLVPTQNMKDAAAKGKSGSLRDRFRPQKKISAGINSGFTIIRVGTTEGDDSKSLFAP